MHRYGTLRRCSAYVRLLASLGRWFVLNERTGTIKASEHDILCLSLLSGDLFSCSAAGEISVRRPSLAAGSRLSERTALVKRFQSRLYVARSRWHRSRIKSEDLAELGERRICHRIERQHGKGALVFDSFLLNHSLIVTLRSGMSLRL